MEIARLIFFALFFPAIAFAGSLKQLVEKIDQPLPSWMQTQIEESVPKEKFSARRMDRYFAKYSPSVVRFELKKGKVLHSATGGMAESSHFVPLYRSLSILVETFDMPDCVFYVDLSPKRAETAYPLFVFSKKGGAENQILLPHFASLAEKYQVLPGRDVTEEHVPWENKAPSLVTQNAESIVSALAIQFPHLLKVPKIPVSFGKLFNQKYQFLAGGNGEIWPFFSNSALLKQNADEVFWYSAGLIEDEHFIAVQADYANLIGKINWLLRHDKQAQKMAAKAYSFAMETLTQEQGLLYLYHLINHYSKISFKR